MGSKETKRWEEDTIGKGTRELERVNENMFGSPEATLGTATLGAVGAIGGSTGLMAALVAAGSSTEGIGVSSAVGGTITGNMPGGGDHGLTTAQQKAFARSRRNLGFMRGDRARRSALRGQNVNASGGSASILSAASTMQTSIPGPTGASGVRA